MVHFITRVPMVLVANHRFETNATIASQVVAAYANPDRLMVLVTAAGNGQPEHFVLPRWGGCVALLDSDVEGGSHWSYESTTTVLQCYIFNLRNN